MGDVRKLKEGEVMRYSKGFLGGKWKKTHAVLFSDSNLCLFDEKVRECGVVGISRRSVSVVCSQFTRLKL